MNKDLTTAILASVIGVVASYFVANLFLGETEDFTISTVDPNLSIDLVEPSNEVFNYLAVNPTVEVYVGECTEYDDQTGECLDEAKGDTSLEEDNTETEDDEEKTEEEDNEEETKKETDDEEDEEEF